MSDKTRIVLEESPEGPKAPCGCIFHYWDGQPAISAVEAAELPGIKVAYGKIAPHWHPCVMHAQAEGLLFDLVDENPCSFDHHGNCQAHGWFGDRPCPHARIKEVTAKL